VCWSGHTQKIIKRSRSAAAAWSERALYSWRNGLRQDVHRSGPAALFAPL
jgi:hypothetical protein